MKFLFVSFCIWLCIQTNAQFSSVSTQSSHIIPLKSYTTSDGGRIILKKTSDEQGGRHWKKFRYELLLLKYSRDGLLTTQKFLGKEQFGALYADLIKSDGRFWIIYFEPVDGTEVGNVKAMEIDPITLEAKETRLMAEKEKIDEKISPFGGFYNKTIFMKSAPDAKFHLLLIDNNENEFYLSCLNEKLESVWNSKVNLAPYKQKEINAYEIDDKGFVYIAAVNKDGAQLSIFDLKGNQTHKALSLGSINPTDMQVLSTNDQVILAGFYGNKENAKGVYFANFDTKSNSLKNIRQTAFPDSLIQRLKKDGFASVKASKYGINIWQYRSRLIEQLDGNVNLITELNAELGNDRIRAKGVGSLIVSHLTMSPSFFSHIPRYSVSNSLYAEQEYYSLSCHDKTFLFYWDDASNLSKSLLEEQKILKGTGNAVLVGAAIKNDGSILRKVIPGGMSAGSIENFYQKECN